MPLLTLLFALVLGAEPATGVVGTVVEARDGSPVPYARIGLPAHAVGAVSAADGSFTIDVVLDRHAVIAANDLLLALEWVDDDSGGEEPPLMFRGERTARSNLYQRPNAQAAFRTVFEVGLESPDTGCEQYADWWEVLDDKGRLLVRRILRHGHVGEQPFVRASDPVAVDTDATLWIRGHMHPTGYGGLAMHGTAAGGFAHTELDPESVSGLSDHPPLPSDCRF